MCRHATFEVLPEPRSVPSAREFCRDTLAGWELAHVIDDAQLVLSELVTNGVLHAGTPLGVTLSIETGNLEIAVSDGSSALPTVRPLRDDLVGDLDELNETEPTGRRVDDRDPSLNVGPAGSVVGGRGLQLVTSLAAAWGVDTSSNGKSVWARLSARARPSATDCPCRAGGITLSSGRTVVADDAPVRPPAATD